MVKRKDMSSDNSNGNDDYMMDYNPLTILLKSIENDVTTEEEILTLDKDCEYCQIISKSSSGNEKYVYKIGKRHCLFQIS